jgi:hypothetical protein
MKFKKMSIIKTASTTYINDEYPSFLSLYCGKAKLSGVKMDETNMNNPIIMSHVILSLSVVCNMYGLSFISSIISFLLMST